MAKRRRRKTTHKRRSYARRNPSRARRVGRAIARRAGGSFHGLNFKSALKTVPMQTIGMLAAKWLAKRFGDAATETDPTSWNYASYLKGAAGAAAAGFLANMVRPGSGQKVLEGGLSLMLYKLVQNELIPKSEWATGQFGQNGYEPGMIEQNSVGEPYILGEDNQWYPLNGADDDRLLPSVGYGSELVTPGPLGFGDELVTPGPLGFGADEYERAFLRR